MPIEPKDPVVFIHYSWDNEKHKEWVLFLAKRLVADGVDVVFDRFYLRIGSNNTYFMEKIENVDKVVLVMTETYKKRANERAGGVGYEYQIISNEISKNIAGNCKFLPVLRMGSREKSIPSFLQSFLYLDMTIDSKFEAGYVELLRNIYNEHEIEKPALGKKPEFIKQKASQRSNSGKKTVQSLFDLGHSKRTVRSILGIAQEESPLFAAYWSSGLQVYYNRHSFKVDGVLAKQQPSGVAFEGDVMGVKLGDSFGEVKSKLGNPLNWGLPDPYTSFAFYHINQRYLTLALWRSDPDDPSANFRLGSVYGIACCEESSVLACSPIIAVAIEEIRNNKKPQHLERKTSLNGVDLKEEFWHEPYIMSPIYPFLFGGYYSTVVFTISKKAILFWLYDLGWSSLVIRMITPRKEETSETN